jgi:hypothetical protein
LSIKKDKVVPVTANRTRAYTTLDEIISKVKPILCNCGILIHQHLAGNELITILTHESGEFIASKMTFQSMSGSNTNALQNAGGGLTYLRRYALTSILFINSENDDDGESSSITHSQITTLPSVSDTKLPQMLEYLKTGGDMETITSKYSLSYLQRKFLTDNLNKHKEESK